MLLPTLPDIYYLRKNHADKLFKQIETAFDELSTDQKAINKVYNNTGGLTPLHCAVSDMKSKELDLLLNMGSDIDLKNKRGQTPINLHLQSIHHWDVLDVKQFREILAILAKLLEPKIPKHIQDFILIKHTLEASKNFL